MLVLFKGCVKIVTHDKNGYQAVLALRGAGDVVGENAGVDGSPRSATVQTLLPVEALVVPADQFNQFLRARPEASLVLQRCISARLRESDWYRASGSANVSQRLAALLLELGERYGDLDEKGSISINLPLSQEDLAGFLVISRRTVARALEAWRESGLIVTGRRSIIVVDPGALEDTAHESR